VYVPAAKYEYEASQTRVRTDYDNYKANFHTSDALGYGSRLSHAASEQRIPTADHYVGQVPSYSRKSI